MLAYSLLGYVYISLGLFCMIYFAGKLLLQLLAIVVGLIFIFQGLKVLAVNRAIYYYSTSYFKDQFKK